MYSHELLPEFSPVLSFYRKAIVRADQDMLILESYKVPVVILLPSGDVLLTDSWDHSATTLRHVREFLKQNGHIPEAASKATVMAAIEAGTFTLITRDEYEDLQL